LSILTFLSLVSPLSFLFLSVSCFYTFFSHYLPRRRANLTSTFPDMFLLPFLLPTLLSFLLPPVFLFPLLFFSFCPFFQFRRRWWNVLIASWEFYPVLSSSLHVLFLRTPLPSRHVEIIHCSLTRLISPMREISAFIPLLSSFLHEFSPPELFSFSRKFCCCLLCSRKRGSLSFPPSPLTLLTDSLPFSGFTPPLRLKCFALRNEDLFSSILPLLVVPRCEKTDRIWTFPFSWRVLPYTFRPPESALFIFARSVPLNFFL